MEMSTIKNLIKESKSVIDLLYNEDVKKFLSSYKFEKDSLFHEIQNMWQTIYHENEDEVIEKAARFATRILDHSSEYDKYPKFVQLIKVLHTNTDKCYNADLDEYNFGYYTDNINEVLFELLATLIEEAY